MRLIISTALALSSMFCNAQQGFLGISSDNYVGSTSAMFNASSIVDSRTKIGLSTTYSIFNQSNYFGKNYSIYNVYAEAKGRYFEPANEAFSISNLSMEMVNFKYEWKHKHAISYAMRGRMFNVTDNIPQLWGQFAANDYLENTANTPISFTGLRMSHIEYAEMAFTYATVIFDKKTSLLKGGASLKYLNGLLANNIVFNSGNVSLVNTNDGDADFSDVSADFVLSKNTGDDFYKNRGFGFDIGFTYEWRPDYDKQFFEMDGKKDNIRYDINKYKLKLGLALTDIGSIKFERDSSISNFHTDTSSADAANILIASNVLNNPVNFIQGIQQDGTILNGQSNTFKMMLPTTLALSVDYHLFKNIYLGYNLSLPLVMGKENPYANFKYAQCITPRLENKTMSLMMPVSHHGNGKVHLGVAGRVGHKNFSIYAGSANIDVFFGKKVSVTRNFFAGIILNVLYENPSDMDMDKISDDLDACPTEFGVLEFNGCPDTDGDGIMDKEDLCIFQKGPKGTNGCPDADGDGLIDLNDACPNQAGLAIHYGCPDRDFDGVIDVADRCPDVPGVELNNGCPFENPGCCMDNDGDGVTNAVDKCPDHAGSVYNDGCPIDSVFLQSQTMKFRKTQLDANHTGEQIRVLSNKDTIRNVFTSKAMMDSIFKSRDIIGDHNVYFNSDQYTLTDKENDAFNLFFNKVIAEPSLSVMIVGHTDQDGSEDYNLILSKKRAEMIQKKMIEYGFPKEQIEMFYYGESKALKKQRGLESTKKLERRVEIKVIQRE